MALIKPLSSFFIKITAFIAVILLCVHFLLLQSTPTVIVSSAQQVDHAQSVNALLYDVSKLLKERKIGHNLTITQAQGQSLLGFLQRALPAFNGNVEFSRSGGILNVSYHVKYWFVPRYLNLQLHLITSNKVDIHALRVGRVPLPGNLLLKITSWLVNLYTSSDIATQAQRQVTNVNFDPGSVYLTISPLDSFLIELKAVRERIDFGGDESMALRVRYYLGFLMNVQSIPKKSDTSLAMYIRELMLEAQIQSQPDTAHLENEAAILALVIYAGNHKFANLVGMTAPAVKHVLYGDFMPVMAHRKDLSQHFIYSAAIKLLSDQGVTVAIGEFKELMDRVDTGSGYSFVDLAADKAGLAFADYLTDPQTAALGQARLAVANNEALFFPSIAALPEGLNTDEFTQAFSAVDSPAYQAVIADIKQRIAALPLYN